MQRHGATVMDEQGRNQQFPYHDRSAWRSHSPTNSHWLPANLVKEPYRLIYLYIHIYIYISLSLHHPVAVQWLIFPNSFIHTPKTGSRSIIFQVRCMSADYNPKDCGMACWPKPSTQLLFSSHAFPYLHIQPDLLVHSGPSSPPGTGEAGRGIGWEMPQQSSAENWWKLDSLLDSRPVQQHGGRSLLPCIHCMWIG